jgi:outer membrane protein
MLMKQQLKVAVVAWVGMLMAGSALAAEGQSPWMVRTRAVFLNFENSQSDGLPLSGVSKVEANSRWIPEVDVSYFFSKNFSTELVLTYPQNIDIKLRGDKVGTVKALPPSLLAQYHMTEQGGLSPYVGLGVNYTRFSQRSHILDGAAQVDSSSWGLVGQVGVDYALNKNWSINLDAKYIQMSTDVQVSGSKVGSVGLNPWALGIGVGYRF